MRFILKHIFFFLLLIFMSLLGFVAFTEEGLKICVRYVQGFIPDLKIQIVQGKLFNHFRLKNISYQNAQQTIHIKSVDFAWNPYGLLASKFVIENIALDDADINIKPSSNTSSNVDLHWLSYIILKKFTFNHLHIQHPVAEINLNGSLGNEWNTVWQLHIPQLAVVSSKIQGSLSASGTIIGPQFTPTLTTNVQADKVIFEDHALPKLDAKIQGKISRDEKSLAANINFTFMKIHSVLAEFSLPKFTNPLDFNQPVVGKVTFTSTHLELLNNFTQEIKNPSGKFNAVFSISGTLINPEVASNISLENGHALIPNLGLNLQGITLHAAQNSLGKPITYQGSFQSGKGNAALDGIIDISQTNIPVTLNVKGIHLQIANLEEYKITASPNLNLRYANNNLMIDGSIDIPSADIRPKSFGGTVELPSEVVFVDVPKRNRALPFAATVHVMLHLGDNIHIAYQDLDATLSGEILITQTPKTTTTATGSLFTTKGTYKAFNKTLTIQEGRLIYTGGPLINPGLNIKAVKQIKTVSVSQPSSFESSTGLTPMYAGSDTLTVGVRVEGTFEKPIVSLSSSSSDLSQEDILSYLMFGYPKSQISSQQLGTVLSAASAIGFGGTSKFGDITGKVQSSLGLSEMNVESTPIFNPTTGNVDSTTSFVVGKQLAPNLSAHYSIGIFNPVSIFNLRYQISKRFALQSETSSLDNGADLLYSIERN